MTSNTGISAAIEIMVDAIVAKEQAAGGMFMFDASACRVASRAALEALLSSGEVVLKEDVDTTTSVAHKVYEALNELVYRGNEGRSEAHAKAYQTGCEVLAEYRTLYDMEHNWNPIKQGHQTTKFTTKPE